MVYLVLEICIDWLKSEIGSFLLFWLVVFLISVFFVFIGYFFVYCFVFEVVGFGILEIEGVMDGMCFVCWW